MSNRVRPALRGRPWRLAVAFLAAVSAAALVASPGLAAPSPASAGRNTDPQSTDNLDPATLATMRAQEKLQPALQAIGDEQLRDPDSGYAGVAFEGDGLTLYWKGSLTAGMSTAVGRARAVGPVTVKPAAYSSAELHAASAKINERITAHVTSEIQEIDYPVDGSGLDVQRAPATQLDELRAANAKAGRAAPSTAEQILAEAKVSVPVRLSTAANAVSLMSTRQADSQPWNGGDQYDVWHTADGSWRGTCTTGFGVHASGRSWILTAAHCASVGDFLSQGASRIGPVNSDQNQYDLLLVDTSGWHIIFDGTKTTSNTKNVNSWGYWAANELVCQSGATSGTVCGLKELSTGDVHITTCNSDGICGYTISFLIKCTQVDGQTSARGGDSGGPVFALDGSGVRAKGITSAADGSNFYFQDWADVINLFGAYPNTSSATS